MKKRNLMAILACTVCLATASAGAPAVMAEETEAVTEAATEAAEDSTEADTEETYEKVPRPDYTASDYVELGEYKGLTVKIAPIEVTDEEILAQISANAGSDAMEDVTEGTVEEATPQISIMSASWTERHLTAAPQRGTIWRSVPAHLSMDLRMAW